MSKASRVRVPTHPLTHTRDRASVLLYTYIALLHYVTVPYDRLRVQSGTKFPDMRLHPVFTICFIFSIQASVKTGHLKMLQTLCVPNRALR